jgi:phosphoribosylaminoimidazole-succinocarboxamide synthase
VNPQPPILLESNIDAWPLIARGKVRDIYRSLSGDELLIIASDRISAFDYILGSGIPDKGRVLTQMTLFWLEFLKDLTPNHLITATLDEYPAELRPYREQLEGRSMLVKRARMIDVECVARGYLSGSAWKEYLQLGSVCGIVLPEGLRESDKLPQPIFTPATKAASGHDENIPIEFVIDSVGAELARRLRELTLTIYDKAAAYAATRGILLADTKFEFGFVGDQLVLADEALTPDSSRFWPAATYSPGGAQPSYDKQYVRDYLESIHWNKLPPAPSLPAEVAARTSEKYKEAYRALTGASFS